MTYWCWFSTPMFLHIFGELFWVLGILTNLPCWKRCYHQQRRGKWPLGQPLPMEIPVTAWFLVASWIKADNPFVQRRKRLGERGSPWRILLVGIMFPWATSFMMTEYITDVMHCMIKFTHLALKPNFSITFWMNLHSTLSDALLI